MIRSRNHMEVLTSVLEHIEDDLARRWWNRHQKDIDSPFRNTGNEYENDTFKVQAYRWDVENDEPNFQYKDMKVWWYKRLGRGMVFECDKNLTLEYLDKMLADCIESLEKDLGA